MVHGTVRVTPVYGDTLTYRGIGGESTDGPGSVKGNSRLQGGGQTQQGTTGPDLKLVVHLIVLRKQFIHSTCIL